MSETSDKEQQVIFELKGISKSFDGLQALDNVDLIIHRGERHAEDDTRSRVHESAAE